MIAYKLCSSCFCEIWALFVVDTYDHFKQTQVQNRLLDVLM